LWLDDFELIVIDTVSTSISEKNIPNDFTLKQNYPNPFNPQTTIEYSLLQKEFVNLQVFNLKGQLVKTLISKQQEIGNYSVIFDGSNFASGIYFYRIEAGEYSNTKKLVLMK
ncbi:MAG: T9SS type A sorting domain-containing protein, partial [Candidatus Marinimicrobia bacterium]|nr:T9SS type A sorting domain-containing protein [Candidatus Neomarinimicrobiota bacterium]